MGGGKKKQYQEDSRKRSEGTANRETERAATLQNDLARRKQRTAEDLYGPDGMADKNRANVENFAITGGYDPGRSAKLRTGYDELATGGDTSRSRAAIDKLGGDEGYGRETYQDFALTGGYDPTNIRKGMDETRGGYRKFADTGGFFDSDISDFMHYVTAPTKAIYGRAKDDMNRRNTLQGGYSPGFSSSAARLTRQGAQAGSEASLAGKTNLAAQIREGKLAGLGGLERSDSANLGLEESIRSGRAQGAAGLASTRGQIEAGRQGRAGMELDSEAATSGRQLAGLEGARALENDLQSGRAQGVDALQRYTQFGVASLNQNDLTELQNRMNEGNISQADSQLLSQLAAQQKSLFDKIMQGVNIAGGALTGVGAVI